jgi:hypothetical protein
MLQGELDAILFFLKHKGLASTFKAIQEQLKMRVRRDFTLNQFRQLTALAPTFYGHHWDSRNELNITLPEHATMNSIEPRKAHFKSIIA